MKLLPKSLLPAQSFCLLLGLTYSLGVPDIVQSQVVNSSVTIAWTPPQTCEDGTPLNDLGGFKLYAGLSSRNYDTVTDVGNQSNKLVSNLVQGDTYYFSVTAYDAQINESAYSEELIYTVPEDPMPTIINPVNGAVFGESDSIWIEASVTDTDNSTVRVDFYRDGIKLGEDNTSPFEHLWDNVPIGTYELSVQVIDSDATIHGSDPISVTVQPHVNQPPTVTAPSDPLNQEGVGVNLQISASDPDGDTLTYTADGLPAGLSIGGNSGLVSGTLSYESAGTYPFTITVSDGTLTDSASITWTVVNVNRAPSLVNPGDQTDLNGAGINLTVSVTDLDGDTPTFGATGLPPGLSINGGGLIAGTLTAAGSYDVTITVDDGSSGTDSVSFTWTVTHANQPPTVFIVNPVDGATFDEGDSVVISVDAADSDGSIVRVEYYADDLKLGEGLAGPYEFTWNNAPTGICVVRATATDNDNVTTTSDGLLISMLPRQNLPPTGVLTSPADNSSFVDGDSVTISVIASDPDGAVAGVEFFVDQTLIAADSTPPYEASWSDVREGAYEVSAVVFDDAGDSSSIPSHSVTVLPQTTAQDVFLQDDGSDGIVSIELEHYHGYAPNSNSGWSIARNRKASGSYVVRTSLEGAEPADESYALTQARLDYLVLFTQEGTHYVWTRGGIKGRREGSVFFGINGTGASPDERLTGYGRKLDWLNTTVSGPVAKIHVPSAGVYTISLWVRQSNLELDKLVLTSMSGYQPSGNGPSESPQVSVEVAAGEIPPIEVAPSSLELSVDQATGRMSLVFPRRQADSGHQFIVETSGNLTTWVADNLAAGSMSINDSGGGIEECSFDFNMMTNVPSEPIFYRIRVEP